MPLFSFYSKFQYILDDLQLTECKKTTHFKNHDYECCIIERQYAIIRFGNRLLNISILGNLSPTLLANHILIKTMYRCYVAEPIIICFEPMAEVFY